MDKFTEYRLKRLSLGEVIAEVERDQNEAIKTLVEHQNRMIDVIKYMQDCIDRQDKRIEELYSLIGIIANIEEQESEKE